MIEFVSAITIVYLAALHMNVQLAYADLSLSLSYKSTFTQIEEIHFSTEGDKTSLSFIIQLQNTIYFTDKIKDRDISPWQHTYML